MAHLRPFPKESQYSNLQKNLQKAKRIRAVLQCHAKKDRGIGADRMEVHNEMQECIHSGGSEECINDHEKWAAHRPPNIFSIANAEGRVNERRHLRVKICGLHEDATLRLCMIPS